MKLNHRALAHVLAVFLLGLLTSAETMAHGQLTAPTFSVGGAVAALTALVHLLWTDTAASPSQIDTELLRDLVDLAKTYAPLIDKVTGGPNSLLAKLLPGPALAEHATMAFTTQLPKDPADQLAAQQRLDEPPVSPFPRL